MIADAVEPDQSGQQRFGVGSGLGVHKASPLATSRADHRRLTGAVETRALPKRRPGIGHWTEDTGKIALMYSAVTNEIRVTVRPEYSPEQSEPSESRYFWTYTIEIANLGACTRCN